MFGIPLNIVTFVLEQNTITMPRKMLKKAKSVKGLKRIVDLRLYTSDGVEIPREDLDEARHNLFGKFAKYQGVWYRVASIRFGDVGAKTLKPITQHEWVSQYLYEHLAD